MSTNSELHHSLQSIDRCGLASVTGGGKTWDRIKNGLKFGTNAQTHVLNTVLPDSVTVGPFSWNVGKIPTPFKDNPFKKWRKTL